MFDSLDLFFKVFVALAATGRFLLSLWWIYIPVFLLIVAHDLRIKYIRNKFINKISWVLLEVIPPRDVQKTPRAIEQFFSALHASQSKPNWEEQYLKGEVQNWFSLEIISHAGEIHFLIRTTTFYRNMVEAQIYAQYPEAEIREAIDYVNVIPADVPNQDYDLWGTELMLVKEDAYPIKTYPEFEKDIMVEEQRIDPMSSLLEVMGKLQEGEYIWIQNLIRAVDDKWKKDAEKLRDKLIGRVAAVRGAGIIRTEAEALVQEHKTQLGVLLSGERIEAKKVEEPKKINPMDLMTKSEKDVITAIENNIAKFGFETVIRFLYIARVDKFNKVNVPAVIGAFKQFGTQNLNGFKPNKAVTTKIDFKYELKGPREVYRKKKILTHYRQRFFEQHSSYINYLKPFLFERLPILNKFFIRSKPFVLNTEELATVYHYPGMAVKAPLVPKIEAKKGEPPIGLPVE